MRSLLFVFTLLLSAQTLSCDINGKSGFMPKNDMKIGVDAKFRSDMTEKEFGDIIDKVTDVYKPIIRKRRGFLKVSKKWSNDTVNASAMRLGPVYLLNMFGGLARHPDVTNDAFALVVCHELGHHLGGAPKNSFPMGWASNEGQSDYFANLKCFRRVFGNDNNIYIVSKMKVDVEVSLKCFESWSNLSDVALCERSSMAGKSLAKLLSASRGVPNFMTPDTTVVETTNNKHPKGQCRLDTYFQGALCTQPLSANLSKKDPNVGTCNRVGNDKIGVRPLCWYKPKNI